MNAKFDKKSLLTGMAAGALGFALLGATTVKDEPVGRYQAVMSETQALIVDTASGQSWIYLVENHKQRHPDFFEQKVGAKAK